MNKQVDAFISSQTKWQEGLALLRQIVLETGLEEAYKWGSPCYTLKGANVVGMRGFKEYFAIWFFKGALLRDTNGLLAMQDGTAQAMRQLRFKSADEVAKLGHQLKQYISEAIEIENAGLKVEYRKPSPMVIVAEFQEKLDEMPALQAAFESLSPGRQREYAVYFSEAKLSATRASRVAKCISMILEKKGLNDKYKC